MALRYGAMLVLAVAVISAVVYAVWVVWVPLLPTNLYVPLLDLGKITGYRWPSALLYLSIVLLQYVLYGIGYRATTTAPTRKLLIFGSAALFCAELVFAYPATAVDVFGYIAHGRLLALHEVNPFVVAPNAYPSDAIVPFLAFPDEPSQYGPIWVLLGGAIARLAQGDLLKELVLYKVIAAAAHLASGFVVYRIARDLTRDEARADASALLFLWNPMLLWEMVGNAHNDGLMMLFGLLGVWLFVARFDLLAIAAVATGALVKVPVALIAPTLFLGIFKRTRARAIEGALLALALAFAVYRPFWVGPETLTVLHRDLFTASLGSVLRLLLEPSQGLATATSVARTVSLSGFAIVAVLALILAVKAHDDVEALRPAYFTVLAALLLLTTWFQAWYVVWPFAIGAALGEPRRHLEVALLSLGGLLQYFVFIYLWVMGYFPPSENLAVQSAAYAAIVAPLALALLWRLVLSARRGSGVPILSRAPAGDYH